MKPVLDKLLLNPVRLQIVSALMSVENCDFNYLKELTSATSGNLSIQIKKLEGAGYISTRKKFEKNYPKTRCKITKKGRQCFIIFFESLKTYDAQG